LADENFPVSSYQLLLKYGWDIIHIALVSPSIEDEDVIKLSIKENRIILTFDSDFGALVFKSGLKPIAVVYFRWDEFKSSYPAKYLHQLLQQNQVKILDYFTVIGHDKIRQRKI